MIFKLQLEVKENSRELTDRASVEPGVREVVSVMLGRFKIVDR